MQICKAPLRLSPGCRCGVKCQGACRPGTAGRGTGVWRRTGCPWWLCAAPSTPSPLHTLPSHDLKELHQDFFCLGIQILSESKFVFWLPSVWSD